MNTISLKAEGLAKRYGFRMIFRDIDFELTAPSSLVICGPNGSGKSTLLRIVTGLESPTKGKIHYSSDKEAVTPENISEYVAYIAPDMNFYHELSGLENLRFFMKVSGRSGSDDDYGRALEQVGLDGRGDDFLKEYSTGMRVRLKYALMLLIKPEVMILDEPTSNLDRKGKEIIYNLMEKQKKSGILIFATNEHDEIARAEKKIELDV